MHPVRVLIVEHETLTRIGVRTVLAQDNIEIVGEAETAAEGFELFKAVKPDVAILSLRMPDSCAIDDLGAYFIENPQARIIVLADHAGDAEITRALKKGALGYVCKDIRPYELVKAVQTVAKGRKYIPPDIAGILSEHLGEEELTPSEQTVLRMIVGGMQNKEIAFALDISENTVKTHIKNIFEKIGVSDRTSAATVAIKRGLVRIDL
jgi:DNA-binding NarL/FixJ family response regulator